jgi:hypothetical protein
MSDVPNPLEWAERTWSEYETGREQAGDRRPLGGYAAVLGAYAVVCGGAAVAVRRRVARGRRPERPGAFDLLLTTVAVFRASRTLSKDAVMSPLRAPFATYLEPGGPGEVMEAPRSGPVRHAVGELVTCPLCVSQWVATAAVVGHLLAPTTTRWICAGLSTVAGADALQLAYARLQAAAE